MNELIYNVKLTLGFTLIITFVLFWYMKLQNQSLFHSSDFESLTPGYTISTGSIVSTQKNTIFLRINNASPSSSQCLKNIPSVCIGKNRSDIDCLALLKEKGNGYYNGFYFRASDIKCRK